MKIQMILYSFSSCSQLPSWLPHDAQRCKYALRSAHLKMHRVGAPSEFTSFMGRHCSSYSPGSTSSSTRPSSGIISCIHGTSGGCQHVCMEGKVYAELMCLQCHPRRHLQACSMHVVCTLGACLWHEHPSWDWSVHQSFLNG